MGIKVAKGAPCGCRHCTLEPVLAEWRQTLLAHSGILLRPHTQRFSATIGLSQPQSFSQPQSVSLNHNRSLSISVSQLPSVSLSYHQSLSTETGLSQPQSVVEAPEVELAAGLDSCSPATRSHRMNQKNVYGNSASQISTTNANEAPITQPNSAQSERKPERAAVTESSSDREQQ